MLVFCVEFYRYKVQWSTLELILQCLILHILQYKWQCPHPNPSHCEGFSNVPFLNALRSDLLTFFSSLVIQESLINCAGERRRSEKDSHCESFSSFCLSALYPVVEFARAETQAFLALSARLYKSLTAKLEPSSSLNAFAHIL